MGGLNIIDGRVKAAAKDLQDYNDEAAVRDPSRIAYPATLPIELALKTAAPSDLRIEYGYTPEEWDALRYNPAFLADLISAVDLVKQEGMSFRLKARLQSEELLKTSWRLIHAPNDEVAPSVKSDLIKTTFRVAGFDQKDNGLPAQATFQIQVNL